MKRTFYLSHDEARRRVGEFALSAPDGWRVDFIEPRKTRPQEEKYHAQIGDIAEQYEHAGRKWDSESMKRLLVAAFREDTKTDPDLIDAWKEFGDWELVPGIRGGFTVLGVQTRSFPKRLASAFIEWLQAFGDEAGVKWSEPRSRRPREVVQDTGEILETAA